MATETSKVGSEENLETFSLIWLDASVNDTQENVDAQHQLRKSINFLKTFNNADDAEKYIRSLQRDDRIVFIVSGGLGQTIVPRIHSLRQISTIYVYCKDKKFHESWSKDFKKVRGVVVLLDELISLIQSNRARRGRNIVDEPLSVHFSNTKIKQEQSTSDLGGQFVCSQLLIDCLLRMKTTKDEKKEFISLCRKFYKGNEFELLLLDEFENFYSPERALWWYTRESFLYRLMNKALRVLNVELLCLLGFFIRDVQRELKKRQCMTKLRVYRCQLMSIEEIQLLKNTINKCVAINSYFSTSLTRSQALNFLDYSSDLEQVLFEIDADPNLKGVKPFADITAFSYYPDEEEILFMIGTIFRIKSVKCDEDELWTLHLELVSDHDHDANSIISQLKDEYMQQEVNILTYGNILGDMGKVNEAEHYYRRFLNQSSSNPLDLAHCYYSLGTVTSKKGKYDESLQWHLDALAIRMEKLSPKDPNLASSHNAIAIVYRKKGDHIQALKSYEKSLKIWEIAFGESHPKVAMCLNNIGAVYEDQKDYTKALEYFNMAIAIAKQHTNIDYRSLSAIHNNLGNIYFAMQRYDDALKHYKEAFQIKSQILSYQHPNLAMALRNIGRVYKKKGSLKKAEEYYKQADEIDPKQ